MSGSEYSSEEGESTSSDSHTEASMTPRTTGKLKRGLEKVLPSPPNQVYANPTAPHRSKIVTKDLSLPVPEILPPIVFHADFGVSEDLSIRKQFVSSIQPGISVSGAKKSTNAKADVYAVATTGVNAGVGLIGSRDSVSAKKSGTGQMNKRNKQPRAIAHVAAGGTATNHGTFRPIEPITSRTSGTGPRRSIATSGEETGSNWNSGEESGSYPTSVVISTTGAVVKTLPAPSSSRGSRVSSRPGSANELRTPRSVASESEKQVEYLPEKDSFTVVSYNQPENGPTVKRRPAAVASQPTLVVDTQPTDKPKPFKVVSSHGYSQPEEYQGRPNGEVKVNHPVRESDEQYYPKGYVVQKPPHLPAPYDATLDRQQQQMYYEGDSGPDGQPQPLDTARPIVVLPPPPKKQGPIYQPQPIPSNYQHIVIIHIYSSNCLCNVIVLNCFN